MKRTLEQSMVKLRELSSKLNAETDAANRVVQRVEKFLNDECSIGLPAYMDGGVGKIIETAHSLGYDRVAGKFRIVVRFREVVDDDWKVMDVKPWSDCPRGVKLHTFQQLEGLVDKISKRAEAVLQQHTDAMADAIEKMDRARERRRLAATVVYGELPESQ